MQVSEIASKRGLIFIYDHKKMVSKKFQEFCLTIQFQWNCLYNELRHFLINQW
jgi:hypothetical protein